MTSTRDAESVSGMAELLDTVQPLKALRRGDFADGIIMRIDPEGILVNTSQKSEGMIPPWEMRSLTPEALEQLKVGDPVLTVVVKPESDETPPILSLDRAKGEMGWRTLEKCLENGESTEGRILGFNRGGAMIEVDGVQGFVPMSQLVTISRNHIEDTQQDPEDDAIGQVLHLKVMEVNRRRNRAILSEKLALQEWREKQKERLVQELKEGDIVNGKVTGISNFGAFVDLGGADGLIHISELSWETVQTPEDVVKVGEEIEVYILKVDKENRKIGLSLRRTQPTPWDTIGDTYQVGQLVEGTITKVANFGAFARIEGPFEGLIHISELSDELVRHPKEVVKEGDVLTLKILRIEPERQRLGLSLKQAEEEL